MRTVLTIAGFDPSSGAGVTADLMVFAAHGLFGTACITALTVQSTIGVQSTHAIEPSIVGDTLDVLDADLPPAGIKIGMLATIDNVNQVLRYVAISKRKHESIIVLDPVLRSSSGRELAEPAAADLIREHLLPLVDWITPNLDELAVLAERPVATREDVAVSCRELQAGVAQWSDGRRLGIFATGGHLNPPDDFLLSPNGEEVWLPGEHIATKSTHGTGCALSSAFLARLVLGDPPVKAAKQAKMYVAGALRTAKGYGAGRGPLNHLWPITNAQDAE
jgi:hydroxymethylpyrimidine/phosphomethylpyrimidine kinase